MGMRQRAKVAAKVHLPIPTQGCRKMETQLRYSPQRQLDTSEGNTMELTTDEIIARLMNYSVKLDGEMRFEESATLSQAVALIMSLRNATERLRHPSNKQIVSAIRSQDVDELRQVIDWIIENPS